ncbi:MAG: hypothetical protein R3B09_30695 [Nannocystaceae bacterium]
MPRTLDPTEHREALQALVAYLGEEPDLEEVVAAESQLFAGVLMLGDGAAYFLSRRFGAWEVTIDLPVGELKGVEAVSSFGAQGHEVRLLHNGRLIRFSDLDADVAARIAAALERHGGEGLDARSRARRERAAAGRPAAAPSVGTSLPTPAWSKGAPTSPFATSSAPPASPFAPSPPASPFAPSPPASPFASAPAFRAAPPRPLEDDDVGQVEDDDELFEDDVSADHDDHDQDEAALLARLQRAAETAAAAKTKAAAKPTAKRKILLPMILVGVAYSIAIPFVMRAASILVADVPEAAPYVYGGLPWALMGFCGGLFGRGLGAAFSLLFIGGIAGVAGVALVLNLGIYTPEVGEFVSLAIVSYGYLAIRSGASPYFKALGVTIGAMVLANMFDLREDEFSVGMRFTFFWGLHFLLERLEK